MTIIFRGILILYIPHSALQVVVLLVAYKIKINQVFILKKLPKMALAKRRVFRKFSSIDTDYIRAEKVRN
jgi:hypothetical protein